QPDAPARLRRSRRGAGASGRPAGQSGQGRLGRGGSEPQHHAGSGRGDRPHVRPAGARDQRARAALTADSTVPPKKTAAMMISRPYTCTGMTNETPAARMFSAGNKLGQTADEAAS